MIAADEAPPAPEPEKKSGLRIPRWIDKVLLVVGLGILVYVVSRFEFDQIWAAAVDMWPAVLLTPAIALAWFGTSTSALYVLLEGRISWWRLLWIRLVGDSYNALLPLAGFGGEPFKMRQLTFTVDPGVVMATLIRDRLIGDASGFLFGAVELAAGLTAYEVDPKLSAGLVIYIVVCLVLGASALALVMTRVPGKLGGWLAKLVGDVKQDQIDTLPWPRIAVVFAWYLGSRVLGLVEKVVLLWILGLPHDLVTAAFVDGFISAAGYVGFMIPQGLGVFEAATVYMLGLIGGTGPQAIAFAFARRGRMLVVGLFGVLLHLVAIARAAIVRARAR
jgi:hypothetical protein